MSLSLQSSFGKVPRVLGYSINPLNLLHTGFIKRCLHLILVGYLHSLPNMFITAVAPLSDTRGIVTCRLWEQRSKYESASPRRHSEVRDKVVDGAVGRSKKPNPVSHKKEAANEWNEIFQGWWMSRAREGVVTTLGRSWAQPWAGQRWWGWAGSSWGRSTWSCAPGWSTRPMCSPISRSQWWSRREESKWLAPDSKRGLSQTWTKSLKTNQGRLRMGVECSELQGPKRKSETCSEIRTVTW